MTPVPFDERASRLLADLISLPTVNPMERLYESELPVERPVTDYLESLFKPYDVHLTRETCNDVHENLLIHVEGDNDAAASLFESHIDTVPADDWLDRAFRPRIENGRMYGRGACDDKGSLAAMVLAVLDMLDAGRRPPQTVLLLAAGDEECGQVGIKHFVRSYDKAIGRGVFGEPTSCLPIIQHKGTIRWDITVHGESGHSSEPEKCRNAILDMMKVIDKLADVQKELAAEHDNPLITPPTLTVTMIRGGQTRNALPIECTCAVNFRIVPGMDNQQASSRVIAAVDSLGIPVTHAPFQCSAPALSTAPDDAFTLAVQACCHQQLGREAAVSAVPYGSDAAWIPQGAPAIVLGPGEIRDAHSVDESVELKQVSDCARIYQQLMMRDWASP